MSAEIERLLVNLHDLHVFYGLVHRVFISPLVQRATSIPTIIGTSAGTVGLVHDEEVERADLAADWKQRWWHNGWMRIGRDGSVRRLWESG